MGGGSLERRCSPTHRQETSGLRQRGQSMGELRWSEAGGHHQVAQPSTLTRDAAQDAGPYEWGTNPEKTVSP